MSEKPCQVYCSKNRIKITMLQELKTSLLKNGNKLEKEALMKAIDQRLKRRVTLFIQVHTQTHMGKIINFIKNYFKKPLFLRTATAKYSAF